MGKTRDLFKKIGNIKGTFHARMGMIKDRSGKDLTEAEEIKKRWQEYTEDLYPHPKKKKKKKLHKLPYCTKFRKSLQPTGQWSALRCVVFLQKRLMSFVYKGGFNFLEISLYGNWQLNVITMYKYAYTYNI